MFFLYCPGIIREGGKKKSPRVAPRGKVGWWRKSTYTTIDTWYREKLHLFGKKMQEIVAAKFWGLSAATKKQKFYGLNLKVLSGSCSRWTSWQFLQLF